MRVLSHARWLLLLTLAGALLVEWLHWEFVVFLVAMILAERLATLRSNRSCAVNTQGDRVVAPEASLTRLAQHRLPITLTRLLGGDCPSCRGYGCEACAYTGLN